MGRLSYACLAMSSWCSLSKLFAEYSIQGICVQIEMLLFFLLFYNKNDFQLGKMKEYTSTQKKHHPPRISSTIGKNSNYAK